jgi:ADP-ribosyl-[dinitrogen reductase] hydrolase
MFFHPDMQQAVRYSGTSSRTTHGAMECIESCRVLGGVLYNALDGEYKDSVIGLLGIPPDLLEVHSEKIRAIVDCAYLGKKRHEIRSRGYVVDTLEAALWSFATTESFREAVLTAANLGFDADTVAAVTGQVAGAFYGADAIPREWLEKLYLRDVIDKMARSLAEANAEKGFRTR